MGLFHAGVPPWLIEWVRDTSSMVGSIETGTFRGDSTLLLADHLGQCLTIERDPDLKTVAANRFATDPRIEVRQGSSEKVLEQVCPGLTKPTFFWLDGHWCGGVTAGADDPCPLMAELDAIASSPSARRHIVAVDDARLFGYGHDFDRGMEHWPRLVEVLTRLEELGLETFYVDDVIVAIPHELAPSFLALHNRWRPRQEVFLFPIWGVVETVASVYTYAKQSKAAARLKRWRAPI